MPDQADSDMRMARGFYTIMAAQFFSSLADNALLIVCMALLEAMHAPSWMTPLLKSFFVLSYVLLAAFVGAFADAYPKGRVMFVTNLVKIIGCSLLFFGVHPLIAYCLVGFGAAAYSPAKYGILTELLPAEKLVAANAWIEALTVASIVLGILLGSELVNPQIAVRLLDLERTLLPLHHGAAGDAAMFIIICAYIMAALFNLKIPETGARYRKQEHNPLRLASEFAGCCKTLWQDKLGQITLSVTTLLWGTFATLQFIVIRWAEKSLSMPLDRAAGLQVVVVAGGALGAAAAAFFVPLRRSLSVLPVGVAMGMLVISMTLVHTAVTAYVLLALLGVLAGYFLVPMNALLQHRGYLLMSAGHSIAVQNLNENFSVLVTIAAYSLLVKLRLDIDTIIVLYGAFVIGTVFFVIRRFASKQQVCDAVALIGEHRRPAY